MAPAADVDLASNPPAFPDIPPFSESVPTAPLVRISLLKLANGDADEERRLWEACCDLGFFYLDMRMDNTGPVDVDGVKDNEIDGDSVLNESSQLFEFMKELYALPAEEKNKYNLTHKGIYFGYKGMGTNIIDKAGSRDRNEYWNVSKNDMLELDAPQPNPSVITESRPLFTSYMTHAHAVVTLIVRLLNDRLGLPPHTFENWHRLRGLAGDQVRLIHSPPQPMGDRTLSNGEHTDFGSVTILFNRVGGLQIRLPPDLKPVPPTAPVVTDTSVNGKVKFSQDGSEMSKEEEEEWVYVRPIPGHAVVNLGDAMTKFSAGILRSNIHRVISPPAPQADTTRYSLVYFSRPEDDVKLRHLGKESEMVAKRLRDTGRESAAENEEVVTSKEWVHRMSLGRRGVGQWLFSGGKEMDMKRQALKA